MKTAIIIFILLVFIACAICFQLQAAWLLNQIKNLGWLGYVFFLAFYCLATLFMFPTMVVTLAGGALFGPILGTALNLTGATLGATAAFCISRYSAKNWFTSKGGTKIQRLIEGVEKKGWQFVAFLRLLPIIPFNLVNYGFGITGIKFSHYFWATIIFLAPAELLYTWLGHAGMTALNNNQSLYQYSGLLLCLFGLFILILFFRMMSTTQVACKRD